MAPPPSPTLAEFQNFITTVMAVPATALPSNSPVIAMAFAVALGIVNRALRAVCIPSHDAAGASLNVGGITVFSLAVYNLAADNLINFAADQPGETYFKDLRKSFNTLGFVSGVISGSSDEGTSQTLVVQEAAKAFTLSNIQSLKTPYGRTYLSLAQSYGPSTFGITR